MHTSVQLGDEFLAMATRHFLDTKVKVLTAPWVVVLIAAWKSLVRLAEVWCQVVSTAYARHDRRGAIRFDLRCCDVLSPFAFHDAVGVAGAPSWCLGEELDGHCSSLEVQTAATDAVMSCCCCHARPHLSVECLGERVANGTRARAITGTR